MNSYINPQAKLMQHVDRLAAIKEGRYSPPVNVEIDLSNRCSLGCEWCHFAYTHTRGPLAGKREKPDLHKPGGDLIDVELAESIIEDLSNNGIRSITWTGGGEPTLHPHFDTIIKCAAHYEIDQGLYTHGGHINQDRATLLKHFATWVYVSLDCANRYTYQAEKGVDRFTEACQGISYLANAQGDATIGVGFLIHAGNYTEVQEMTDLALSLGADYAQFRPAVYFDINDPDHATESIQWIDAALSVLSHIKNDKVIVDFNRFKMYQSWRGHGYSTCYWAGIQTVITPDGSLWTCVNKREQASAWLGNLGQESFKSIWERNGGAHKVDDTCRVLCRGHVPNVALQDVMLGVPHGNFI